MAEQVSTSGFVAPPAGNPAPQGMPQIMPQDAKPGFVIPPLNAAPATPAATTVAAPVPEGDALLSAIAALTANLADKKAEPEKAALATESGLNTLDPSDIDDPTLRSMAGAFKMLGADLDFDRVFAKALDTGNADFLDLAYLKEKGGANAAGLADLATSIVGLVNQKAEAQASAVYTLAGGKDKWNAATAAFNASAPEELRMAVTQMADSGKEAYITAATKLVMQFALSQGHIPNPGKLLNASSGNPTGQALDKRGFQDALQKLDPNDRNYQMLSDDLYARRQLGKNLGM